MSVCCGAIPSSFRVGISVCSCPPRKTLPHRRAVVGLSCAFRIDPDVALTRVIHLTARRFACAFLLGVGDVVLADLYRLVMRTGGKD